MGLTHSIYFGSLPRADFDDYSINMFKDQLEKTTSNEKIKELNENIRLLEDFKNEIESTKDKIQEEFPEISPGVFNAGNCCVFKKAISGIEITDGKINLIFWKEESTAPEVIKTEDLDDLFEKIRGIN